MFELSKFQRQLARQIVELTNDENYGPFIEMHTVFNRLGIDLPVIIYSFSEGAVELHFNDKSSQKRCLQMLVETTEFIRKLTSKELAFKMEKFKHTTRMSPFILCDISNYSHKQKIGIKQLCKNTHDVFVHSYHIDTEFLVYVENEFKTQEQINFENQVELSRENTTTQIQQSQNHFDEQLKASEARFEKRFKLQRWAIWIAVGTLFLNLGFQVFKWLEESDVINWMPNTK